jgi:hypothetical protein
MKVCAISVLLVAVLVEGCARNESPVPAGANMSGTNTNVEGKSVSVKPSEPSANLGTQPIGEATMKPDGSIVMNLTATGTGGGIGHAQVVYAPTHPRYKAVLEHIGKVRVGESVLVYPWKDESK